MGYKVDVIQNDIVHSLVCDENSVLIDVLSNNNITIDAPCGGKGLCGKCKVVVEGDTFIEVCEKEFITDEEAKNGVRLACVKRINKDTRIVLDKTFKAKIAIEGIKREAELNPIVKKQHIKIEKPKLDNLKTDVNRFFDALGKSYNINLSIMSELSILLNNKVYDMTVVIANDEIIAIEANDTTNINYAIAIDIGTTTLVAYLVDLLTGKTVDVVSRLNSQKRYGADVISRISYTIENSATKKMQESIINDINEMCKDLISRNNKVDNVYAIALTGNAVMLHFVCGFETKSIAMAPFNSVNLDKIVINSEEIGLKLGKRVFMPMSIASYVGADITCASIACSMDKAEKINLLVDIGTNGEIVLGNKDKMLSCATAAGPAFEGAQIKCGVGGIEGAINTVSFSDKINYTTIGDKEPIGICGSGIVDILAILVENGLVDETGRLVDEGEIQSDLAKYITGCDFDASFKISDNIELTAKDVREIQLAKASIAAGINTLINEMNISVNDIEMVYLAGGFGSYLNKESAIKIGLLPKELSDKIIPSGNAAGSGAVSMLLDESLFYNSEIIKSEYVELSTNLNFQNEYIECMMF